ncbi:MAG: AMP-binding protein [Pseudomonadota bacterium]
MTERLHQRLFAAAEWRGEAPALAAPDASFTHAALADAVRRAAGLLEAQGVRPGDRVVWLGFNAAAQIVLTFAAARLGAMSAPLNWRLAEEELAWIFADAEPRLAFADAAHLDVARRVAGAVPVLPAETLLTAQGEARSPEPSPEAPALLVYTSGASGRPKGALLTHRALAANAALATDMHALTKDDHVHTVLPMFHVGGLNIQTLPALLAGARVTLMERFEPGACLAQIAALRPTLSVHVPASFAALMAHPDWPSADLSSLRLLATGSTDVPVPTLQAVHARGVPVIQIYGATETGPVVVYQREADAVPRLGSIGQPGPKVEIRLTDPQGRDVPDGADGEIRVKSPTLAVGYWRRPDSAREFDGGWWRSGDVARRDAEGWLWFADRVKNVIVSGGENIYPAELERVLAGLPGVREAAVVGRPDPRWGAVPVAVVAGEGLTEADILAAFDGRLARFKRPKGVVFVEALPRNAMGKVAVPEVRALVQRRGAA